MKKVIGCALLILLASTHEHQASGNKDQRHHLRHLPNLRKAFDGDTINLQTKKQQNQSVQQLKQENKQNKPQRKNPTQNHQSVLRGAIVLNKRSTNNIEGNEQIGNDKKKSLQDILNRVKKIKANKSQQQNKIYQSSNQNIDGSVSQNAKNNLKNLSGQRFNIANFAREITHSKPSNQGNQTKKVQKKNESQNNQNYQHQKNKKESKKNQKLQSSISNGDNGRLIYNENFPSLSEFKEVPKRNKKL